MRIPRSNFSVATSASSAAIADRHDPVFADEDVWADDTAIPDQAVQHPQVMADIVEPVVSPLSYAPAIITETVPVQPTAQTATLIATDSLSYPLRSKQMSNNFAVKHWMDQDRTARTEQAQASVADNTVPIADVAMPVAATAVAPVAEQVAKPAASTGSPKPANPSMIMSGPHTAYQGLSVREQFGSGEKVWKNAFTLAENVRFTRTPENELMKLRAKLIEEFGGEQEIEQAVAATVLNEPTKPAVDTAPLTSRVAAPVLRGPSSVIVAARLRLPQVPVPPQVEAAQPMVSLMPVPEAEVVHAVASVVPQAIVDSVIIAAPAIVAPEAPAESGLQLGYLSDFAFWEFADTEFVPVSEAPVISADVIPEVVTAEQDRELAYAPANVAAPETSAASILNLFRTVECRPVDEPTVPASVDVISEIAAEVSAAVATSVMEAIAPQVEAEVDAVEVIAEPVENAAVAAAPSADSVPVSSNPFLSSFGAGFASYQFHAQAQFANAFLSANVAPVVAAPVVAATVVSEQPDSELIAQIIDTVSSADAVADAVVEVSEQIVSEVDAPADDTAVALPPVVEAAAPVRSFAGIISPAASQSRSNSAALNLSIFSPTVTETGSACSSLDYQYPPRDLLQEPVYKDGAIISQEMLERSAGLLESILEDFGVRGEIIHVRPGPVVTLYEFEPAPGVKSSRVIGLADDIARSMSALSARVAVVPGRNVIGIELPNSIRETVYFRELIESPAFERTSCRLALCLGKTIGGEPVVAELAKMPHLLVAGTTGSGKSVAINTMILSLLYRLKPEECRLIMIDPKMLELSIYDGIPHLLTPVVTDPKKAVVALKWTVREMEERYRKMSRLGVRNIDGYNARAASAREKGETVTCTVQAGFDKSSGEILYEEQEMDLTPMPYIVVIVDEMADLMMVAGKEIEGAIQRLAQMARAAGIHLIMATQRPSVDVITGTIKANFPTRISFQVTSKIDSRTILGEQGAEQLLGQGDMLHMVGGGRIVRVHGPFVSDEEVEKVVTHLKGQGRPDYLSTVTADEDEQDAVEEDSAVFDKSDMASEDGDDLYEKAVKVVLRDKKCSTSYIQRRLSIGYNRAASLVERMEQDGLVGAANHVGKREILGQRDGA